MDHVPPFPKDALSTPMLRGMETPRFDECGVLTPKEGVLSKDSSFAAMPLPPAMDVLSCSNNSGSAATPPMTPAPQPLEKPPFFYAQLNGRCGFVPLNSLVIDTNLQQATMSRVNIEFDLDRVRVFVGQVGHSVTAAMLVALFQRLLGELFKPLSCTCGSGGDVKSRGCAYLIVKASDAPKLLTLHHRIYCDYGGFWVASTDAEASLLASTIRSGYSPRDVPRNLMVIELSQTYSAPPPLAVPVPRIQPVMPTPTFCVPLSPPTVTLPTVVATPFTPDKVLCPRSQPVQWRRTAADAVCSQCRSHLYLRGGFGCQCCPLDLCPNCYNHITQRTPYYAPQQTMVQYQPMNFVPKVVATAMGPTWALSSNAFGMPTW